MEISLNKELFNPYYIYNGLDGKAKWTKEYVEAFTEVSLDFLAEEGRNRRGKYTLYSEGTAPYKEFWDREEDRILNGYTYKGVHCPGMYYFYLNYCPIFDKLKKKYVFPNFWDLDFDYFSKIEQAIKEGKHFVTLKKRQCGFSLKNAVPLTYALHTQRGSINYLFAFLESHASKTWSFVKHYLNHINNTTDFYKNRNPDRNDFLKMSFEEIDSDGKKSEFGYLSELHKVVFKDSPDKGVGGQINVCIIEEGGIFNNLEDVIEYIKPATEQGGIVTGLILLFGSVGDLEKCKGLKEIFYNPEKHGFASFVNNWSIDSNKGKECGYYVPEYIALYPFVDEWGNSIIDSYTEEDKQNLQNNILWQRDIKGKNKAEVYCAVDYIKIKLERERKKNLKAFTLYRTQHPIYPEDAFLSRGLNKFPVDLISKQLANVQGNDALKNYGRCVKLQEIEGKIKIETLHRQKRFDEWPVKFKEHTEDLQGNIWIWEDPMPNAPDDLYIASTDSVDQDNLGKLNSDSLFAMYVYKRSSGQLNEYTKKELVASLVGRPELIRDIYEQAEYLEKLYNAKNLVENANVGIINYHNNRNTDRYLQDELMEIKGINPNSNVRRKKGYHPTVEVKNHGDNLIIQYLKEIIETEYDEKGEIVKQVLGIERIKDIGLLKEMLGYDEEANCDRLDALRGCLLFEEALFKKEITVLNGKSPYEALSQRAGKVRKQTIRDYW